MKTEDMTSNSFRPRSAFSHPSVQDVDRCRAALVWRSWRSEQVKFFLVWLKNKNKLLSIDMFWSKSIHDMLLKLSFNTRDVYGLLEHPVVLSIVWNTIVQNGVCEAVVHFFSRPPDGGVCKGLTTWLTIRLGNRISCVQIYIIVLLVWILVWNAVFAACDCY